MPFTVPGIGYIGLGSQTRAAQTTFSQAMRGRSGNGTRKRRRSASATPRRRRRSSTKSRSRRTSRPARMVKGSAAAKRHMAKLRRMRKK